MSKREIIHQQILYYLLLIQAFAFPLWKKITPLILLLLLLNWLLEFNFTIRFKKLFSEHKFPNFLLFISLYVLYLIGLIYTSNFNYAWFDLEVKLTFLLIPFFLFTSNIDKLSKNQIINVLVLFIFGCFVSSVISIAHSYYLYKTTGYVFWFFYTYASFFHHPSYISMYLVFAISCISYLAITDLIINKKLKYFFYFLLIWFIAYVIILSSKAGIISLIFVVLFLFVYWIIKKRNYLISTAIIIFFLLFSGVVLKKNPTLTNRIITSFQVVKAAKNDINSDDGTVQRMEIWKTSIHIIKDNFLIGVGTGDVKDELLKHYDENGMSFAKSNNLNAHGQYFQTFITLGILGFLSLILLFIIPAFQSFKNRNIIYLLFLVIVASNIMVESMFENQAGVIFYTFFNSFLFLTTKQLTSVNSKKN